MTDYTEQMASANKVVNPDWSITTLTWQSVDMDSATQEYKSHASKANKYLNPNGDVVTLAFTTQKSWSWSPEWSVDSNWIWTTYVNTDDKSVYVATQESWNTGWVAVKWWTVIWDEAKIWDIANWNYTEIETDWTQRLKGDATSRKDMIADLFWKKIYSNTWKIDYDWDENCMKFQSGWSMTNKADRVGGNQEINHEFKVWSNIVFRPHIHWFQEIAGGAITHAFELTMRYRLQRNNYEKTTARTTVTLNAGTDDIFDFTSKPDWIYNQLSRFPSIVIDCAISDTIQFQIARTDSVWWTMNVYFADIHGEVDSFWSDEEIAKA